MPSTPGPAMPSRGAAKLAPLALALALLFALSAAQDAAKPVFPAPPAPAPASTTQGPPAAPKTVNIALDMGGTTVPAGSKKGTGTMQVSQYIKAVGIPRDALSTYAEGMKFQVTFKLPPGSYTVELGFAEKDAANCKPGRRVFNVHINELVKLEAFEIYKASGACSAAIRQVFEAQVEAVMTKPLTLRFDAVAGKASVSFIRVRTSSYQCIPDLRNLGVSTGFDHGAHAVPGEYPRQGSSIKKKSLVDGTGKGSVRVFIDGLASHSHLEDTITGKSAVIKSYKWTIADSGEVISRNPTFFRTVKVGSTRLLLRVVDTACSVSEAETTITVTGKEQPGAYCYFYEPRNQLLAVESLLWVRGRPTFSKVISSLNFGFPDFPGKNSLFSMRCIFSVSTKEANENPLLLETFQTGEATLYKGPDLVVDSRTAKNGSTVTADGLTPFELIYRRTTVSKAARLLLSVGGSVPTEKDMSYDQSLVLPIITEISPSSMREAGGGVVRIIGHGLFGNIKVQFGKAFGTVNYLESNPTRLIVTAPGGKGVVSVTAESTAKRRSNAKSIRYGSLCDSVGFKEQPLLNGKQHIDRPAAAELWQDGKLYLGSRSGKVTVVTYNINTLSVISSCGSDVLVDPRYKRGGTPVSPNILGITFDPRDTIGKPYVATSILKWKTQNTILPFNSRSWSNGAVIRLKPTSADERRSNRGRCLVVERTVVKNLPVSGADHGVNDLLFTQEGDLLISVGGFTNAGLPTPSLGGTWEAKLSGAILIAHLSRPTFNGIIDYDKKDNLRLATPTTSDVEPYAVGFRNAFSMAMRRNGDIYVSDNGPNCNSGNASYSCKQYNETAPLERNAEGGISFQSQVDAYMIGRCFTTKSGVSTPDKVLRLVRDGFYGHPNLQRGGDECSWINPRTGKAPSPKNTQAPKKYQDPVALLRSPLTGLFEYGSQHFCGALREELILSRYRTERTDRVRIDEKNPTKLDREPEMLLDYSGLRSVENERGDIILLRLNGLYRVARPQVSEDGNVLFVAGAVPFRFGAGGGGRIRIGGHGFTNHIDVKVSIGGNPCKNQIVEAKLIVCFVPPGKPGGQADLKVQVGLEINVVPKAVLYMKV